MRRRMLGGVLTLSLGLALLGPAVEPAIAAKPGSTYNSAFCENFESAAVSDPSWAQQRMEPEKAWEFAGRGEGVTIAVIDTGVDTSENPVLADATIENLNFVPADIEDDGNNGLDDCMHGTGVVALIVGGPTKESITADGYEFSGIAPDAKVIAMRTLQKSEPDPDAREPIEPTIDAINAAIDRKVDIISISQQADVPQGDERYAQAIRRAQSEGIVVVAAAGNNGHSQAAPYPGQFPGVISVGMVDRNGLPPEQSQWYDGFNVTIGAPGVEVLTAAPSGNRGQAWRTASGTSFAAPFVTGVVALILSENPELRRKPYTNEVVTQRLTQTADVPVRGVPDPQIGWGVVNPVAAVSEVVSGQSEEPRPTRTPTAAPDPDSLPRPDTTARNIALGVAGFAVAATVLLFVLVRSAPSGRRRGWRAPKS